MALSKNIVKTKVSVIIPTYNSWGTLKLAIESIKGNPNVGEIIVIDNCSTDSTFENLTRYFKDVKVFRMDRNTGVTGGRNEGIKRSSAKNRYLLFFDHDMVADKKMIPAMLNIFETHKDAGIVTPKIYVWDKSANLDLYNRRFIWSAGTDINLTSGRVIFRGGNDIGKFEKVEKVGVAPAAMLVSRELINRIKGFDDRYFATYEDTDFCFRAGKVGFSTFYAPSAMAWHNISIDPAKEVDRLLSRAYFVGRNRILFMKDFGKNFSVFLLFLPIYIFYYFKMSLKYKRMADWIKFVRGTRDGLFNSG